MLIWLKNNFLIFHTSPLNKREFLKALFTLWLVNDSLKVDVCVWNINGLYLKIPINFKSF